jgi:hypothetical protein
VTGDGSVLYLGVGPVVSEDGPVTIFRGGRAIGLDGVG